VKTDDRLDVMIAFVDVDVVRVQPMLITLQRSEQLRLLDE